MAASDTNQPVGPYADTNWSTVCRQALEWFCAEQQLPFDPSDQSDCNLYNDEVGAPSGHAIIFAMTDAAIYVHGQQYLWGIYAFANRVPGTSYYQLTQLVVDDITGPSTKELFRCEFDFHEPTARSQLGRTVGKLPAHQLTLAGA